MMRSPANKVMRIILCAAMTGCASPNSYNEPTEPADQLAALKVYEFESYWGFGGSFVEIRGIDGKAVARYGVLKPALKIKSGPHEIAVLYVRSSPFHRDLIPTLMKFSAEPDHSYEIHGVKEQDKIVFWISDATTSQEVARSAVERKD